VRHGRGRPFHPAGIVAVVGILGRKTVKAGPFRFTISRSGLTESLGTRRVRVNLNSHGRRRESVNLGDGLRWTRSR